MFNSLCCRGHISDVVTRPTEDPPTADQPGAGQPAQETTEGGVAAAADQPTAEPADVFAEPLRGRGRTQADTMAIVKAFRKHDIHIPKDIDPELRKQMVAARKVMLQIYTLNLSPANRELSPHRGQDDLFARQASLDMYRTDKEVYEIMCAVDATRTKKNTKDVLYSIGAALGARMLYEGRAAEDWIVGANCGEHAAMGFVGCARQPGNPNLDLMQLKKDEVSEGEDPDHSFVVVGRDQSTDPTDFRDWNEEAFILDPYARAIFPAAQFHEKIVLGQPGFSHGHSGTEWLAHHPENTEFALPNDIREFPNLLVPVGESEIAGPDAKARSDR